MLAVRADGCEVTTVEGLGTETDLHPMQKAFKEHHALQCGYCTPGMLMTAIELAVKNPEASEFEIREHLEGNLCLLVFVVAVARVLVGGY